MRRSVIVLGWALLACGARTRLEADGGNGGAGTSGASVATSSSGSTGTGGAGAGGEAPICEALVLAEPVVPLPTRAAEVWAPALAPASGSDAFVFHLAGTSGMPGDLRATRMAAFGAWPPSLVSEAAYLNGPVVEFVLGPGPEGPVAVARRATDAYLATRFTPTFDFVPISVSARLQFVAGSSAAFLAGSFSEGPEYDVLSLQSYQPAGLSQSEGPPVCVTSGAFSAGVPQGTGFIVAHVAPNPPDPGCNPGQAPPGTIISTARYDVGGSGPGLLRTQGELVVADDRVVHVAVAPASFGAWVVYQYAGDNARTPPAIHAFRVGANGYALDPGAPHLAVSPDGVTTSVLAVTSLGDTLVAVRVDAVDPSSPSLIVQLVRPDGVLGPSVTIGTSAVWQTGRIALLPSPDARSLLVAWEGAIGPSQIGLARVDCVDLRSDPS